jgi:hypothetical protein
MPDHSGPSTLRKEIGEKQNAISDYLSYLEPLGSRLTYVSIICGALAVLLNGETVRTISQGTAGSKSWIFPLVAAILSTIATIAAGAHKSQVESRLSQLQKCAAGLEALGVLLDSRQLSEGAASRQFQKYIEECPVIPRRKEFAFEAIKGTIREPREGQVVQAEFEASGSAQNVGKDAHLWLAAEIDDRIWPKEGHLIVNDVDGQWRHPVFEDGVVDRFGLSLWAANAEADRRLHTWLEECNRTRVFPELRPLPGMRRLARVRGLRRGN